jgi:hypothetical protein
MNLNIKLIQSFKNAHMIRYIYTYIFIELLTSESTSVAARWYPLQFVGPHVSESNSTRVGRWTDNNCWATHYLQCSFTLLTEYFTNFSRRPCSSTPSPSLGRCPAPRSWPPPRPSCWPASFLPTASYLSPTVSSRSNHLTCCSWFLTPESCHASMSQDRKLSSFSEQWRTHNTCSTVCLTSPGLGSCSRVLLQLQITCSLSQLFPRGRGVLPFKSRRCCSDNHLSFPFACLQVCMVWPV